MVMSPTGNLDSTYFLFNAELPQLSHLSARRRASPTLGRATRSSIAAPALSPIRSAQSEDTVELDPAGHPARRHISRSRWSTARPTPGAISATKAHCKLTSETSLQQPQCLQARHLAHRIPDRLRRQSRQIADPQEACLATPTTVRPTSSRRRSTSTPGSIPTVNRPLPATHSHPLRKFIFASLRTLS